MGKLWNILGQVTLQLSEANEHKKRILKEENVPLTNEIEGDAK